MQLQPQAAPQPWQASVLRPFCQYRFVIIVSIMKGFGVEYTGLRFGEIYSTLVLDMSKLVCIPLVVSLVVFFANQGRSL